MQGCWYDLPLDAEKPARHCDNRALSFGACKYQFKKAFPTVSFESYDSHSTSCPGWCGEGDDKEARRETGGEGWREGGREEERTILGSERDLQTKRKRQGCRERARKCIRLG